MPEDPSDLPAFYGHHSGGSSRSSLCSTASNTPTQSRSTSPLPQFLVAGLSSSPSSEAESEPSSPLLGSLGRRQRLREDRRSWWMLGGPSSPRRRRRRGLSWGRTFKRGLRKVVQHPLFPSQPITILLTLLLFSVLALFITLLLIHILNPDKEPLPWRVYCTVPSPYSAPHFSLSGGSSSFEPMIPEASYISPPFPPEDLDSLPPAGVFLGVFSMDSAFERRMLVRSTWASHHRSREGAGDGDGGNGTSRTIVRFILGQPKKNWERRIRLEMETYNDIVILPIVENMNSGKSQAFFAWASSYAWVPPVYFNTTVPPPTYSYTNISSAPPPPAPHDPILAREDALSEVRKPWVRPDFVVKSDDDSFVMLAELEARLRVELHTTPPKSDNTTSVLPVSQTSTSSTNPTTTAADEVAFHPSSVLNNTVPDPLVYWGYLVKNRFMAGELYGLSWSIVEWVARDHQVKALTRGAEDKQTAKWMALHPQKEAVRWKSERCWIYDHPRAGTVYGHGFLFPAEASRVKAAMSPYLEHSPGAFINVSPTSQWVLPLNAPTPSSWAHSSVSTFGVRYTPPVPDLTSRQSVEALVEGSGMSSLREGSPITPEFAWTHREGRRARYEGKRVGGTVVVHFIKKNMWYLETALALLEGEEVSESDVERKAKELQDAIDSPPSSSAATPSPTPSLSGTPAAIPVVTSYWHR
ncbi:glycosyltransferase family 31 protein [Jaapia argillacea MUCL 33604]|uniref:Glycosyltransferase family 31 protein n=1 Tax=Jaapia argillacea MUCL 33604 TaxID=933084 RepID=A0A067Q9E8_9AGAM|nr:glycosyltransferase family 31 protein [Jaapia argillacea MUCL 33604]